MAADKCILMSGWLQKTLQGVLLFASLSVLILKHKWDKKNGKSTRSTVRFFFDSSKQLFGAGWMHIMNLAVAALMGSSYGLLKMKDPCEWYWIEIMIDTTIGVFVEYKVLQSILYLKKHFSVFERLADDIQSPCIEDIDTGYDQEAGSKEQPLLQRAETSESFSSISGRLDKQKYIKQVVVWLLVVTIMKFIMVLTMLVFSPQLLAIAMVVLSPFLGIPTIELLFVMILTPVVMDAVQFYLQDNIFMDVDEGKALETPSAPKTVRRRGSIFKLSAAEAERDVDALMEYSEDLLLVNQSLIAELDYAKAGFVTRIITLSFKGSPKDGPGVYRLTEKMKLYKGSRKTPGQVAVPHEIDAIRLEEGQVVRVLQMVEEDPANANALAVFAKIKKPDGFIMLVNEENRRCAKKLGFGLDE